MNAQARLYMALDQNFPTPLINAVRNYLPNDLVIDSLHKINPAHVELSDRQLFIALHQLGWNGLITNNYKMLKIPTELAAIVKTKALVVAIEGLGHDPLRAVGALLLELPGLAQRVRPSRSNVFRLSYRRRRPEDAWSYFRTAAERTNRAPDDLWRQVGVTDEELARPIWPSS